MFDDGRLKTADYSRDAGFGLRGVSGEMTGFAHANEISAAAIRRAGETLRLLDPGERRARRAAAALATATSTPTPARSTRCRSPQGQAAREDRRRRPRARSARRPGHREPRRAAGARSRSSAPDGFVARDVRPLVRLNVSVVAEANGRRETGSFGHGRALSLRRAVRARPTGAARSTWRWTRR